MYHPPMPTLSEQGLINRVLSAEATLRRAAVNAIVAARDAPGTLQQISQLIQAGRIEEAVQAAGRAGALAINEGSAAVYIQSGVTTASQLRDVLDVTVDFDQVHDFAVDHMRQNRLRLVRQWSDEQRKAAKIVLQDGVTRGLNPIDQAREFRATTGLTGHQANAVRNYRRLLERAHTGDTTALSRRLRDARFDRSVLQAADLKQPLDPKKIDTMVRRYRERSIKRRAETIARTEALRSVNAGNHDAFRQAAADGAVPAQDIRRRWVATADGRTRDHHANASGQEVGLNEDFIVDGEALAYPGDPRASGHNTINCRCTVATRIVSNPAAETPPPTVSTQTPKPPRRRRTTQRTAGQRKPPPPPPPPAGPELHNVKFSGGETFCGPAAMAAVTGKTTKETAAAVRGVFEQRFGRKLPRQIKGVVAKDLSTALKRMKVRHTLQQPAPLPSGLRWQADFNKWVDATKDGRYIVGINVTNPRTFKTLGHWIALEKRGKVVRAADNGAVLKKNVTDISKFKTKLGRLEVTVDEWMEIAD